MKASANQGILVDDQSVIFAVWLALPVLALIGANITLLRTRRHLRTLQPSSAATPIRVAAVPVAQQSNPALAS